MDAVLEALRRHLPDPGELALALGSYLPLLLTLLGVALALGLGHRFLMRRRPAVDADELGLTRPLGMLALTVTCVVLVVLALPIPPGTQQLLLNLLGLAFTGVVAFSSTTFVANAMAGLMLRTVRNFKPGDFLRVEGHYGRVTERGLFHVEIQTRDRDLMTLPNLYLVTHPVTVVRQSGTVVSATVSLGYDVTFPTVEPLLIAAATDAGLEEPFVRVVDLGDFSVTYRVAGLLKDMRLLLHHRSELRRCMLDRLHGAKVEIVSPAFLNLRTLSRDDAIVPEVESLPPTAPASAPGGAAPLPEERIFDKAERAGTIEELREALARLEAEIGELRGRKGHGDAHDRDRVQHEIAVREAHVEAIAEHLEKAEAETADDD